jgi:UV DNA damage endonuclease
MSNATPLRLGFAVKVIGRADIKSNDTRRWQNNPHLRESLSYLHPLFDYLREQQIDMYRMSSDLAPYVTHPDMPQFHHQVAEAAAELRELGRRARAENLRLSLHPSQFVVLNSPDPALVEKSIWDLSVHAELLDTMELGPEAVLIIHVGGTYGDRLSGCRRWIDTYGRLPEPVRRRLVLENDDIRYSAADVLFIHEHTGVPLIFDYQHYWCNNAEGLELRPTLERFVASWPSHVRPKIHYSSPRTELREVKRKNKETRKTETVLIPPIWTGHADYVNPFEFITFMRMAAGLDFDVMLEAKAKDLALLRLRRDLMRYGPDVAARFGLEKAIALGEEPLEGVDEPLEASDELLAAAQETYD